MIVTYLCKCGHKFEGQLGKFDAMPCPKCGLEEDRRNIEFDEVPSSEVPEPKGDNDNENDQQT